MVRRLAALYHPSHRFTAAVLLLGITYARILPEAWLTILIADIAGPACTYLLQAFGVPAMLAGADIFLDHETVSVVAESSGAWFLGMLVFFALAVVVSMVRPLWEKIVLVLSSASIGIVAVILRLTGTCIMLYTFGPALSQADCRPWTMVAMCMVALGLLISEVVYLKYLLPNPARDPWKRPSGIHVGVNPSYRGRIPVPLCVKT